MNQERWRRVEDLFPAERVREFGVYRILSPLGAGDMGEVYRAYDSKHRRH